ncbi:MAG: sigma-54 dependent transcriptional regulator [Deltaproteobacteria bacterium]|nr:sigma-54 dependent transcriptional regulator [Deltaproteobacteria bacterium]
MDAPPKVLIVDDEQSNLDSLERIFSREEWEVLKATNGAQALELLRAEEVNVVLTDLMMPGMSGTELLRAVRTIAPEIEVVLMTAHGTVETAVEAMKEGAYDFVTKPLKRMVIVKAVRKALDRQALVLENRTLRARLKTLASPDGLIGQSPAFRASLDLVRQAAPSNATVLLQGESGTGKELIARALHALSERSDGPFVAVNCAAIPETLLESELFGVEKGAYTGASARRAGRFQRADRGTLFLDEVGELSAPVQAKLLRVLQSGEFERLGGGETLRADVRVLAATNKDLSEAVSQGTFREDLFYRLNVITLTLPPLRERSGDVPLLAQHFLARYASENGKNLAGFTEAAMNALEGFAFPGNVRQLQNIVQRAVVLCRGDRIDLPELPEEIAQQRGGARRELVVPVGAPLEEIERSVILATLEQTRGDKQLAARLLGLSTRTIYRKLSAWSDGEDDEGDEPPTSAE